MQKLIRKKWKFLCNKKSLDRFEHNFEMEKAQRFIVVHITVPSWQWCQWCHGTTTFKEIYKASCLKVLP